jgi:hypothetical protein
MTGIIGTKHLLFLGAGASKPYQKMLMGEFVRSFREGTVFMQAGANGMPPTLVSSTLLDTICKEKEDLEFLLGELEMLSSRNYLATRLVGMRTPESRSNLQWPDIQVLSAEATGLLAKLKHQIYRHYRHIDEPEKTGVLVRTIKLLGGPRQPVVVFTTNYDPAVETFCRTHEFQLIDGFRHDPLRQSYFWSRDAFEDLSDSNLGKLVLFKLHGSTDWFKQGDRLFKGQSMYGADDPDYRHVMIYPATQKIAISEPYFTAYDYLVRCLDAAESCLVVGYSFRDYDTRMRFKSALLTNPSLKIVVLDPDAENLCKNLLDDNILAYPVPYPLDESQEPEYLPLVASAMQTGD